MESQGGGAAAAAPGPNLTFSWLGDPMPDGPLLYYTSFQFCATIYAVGDHVYLTPEDPGTPLYLARITAAFEDTQQQGGDRLCVEVQWYERRANMPENLQAGMHDREVVEWLQTDTNLVGCIERKARVIKARSYEEAVAQLSPEEAAGDWHFCRGVLEVESNEFKTYDEVAADPNFGLDPRTGQVLRVAAFGGGGQPAGAARGALQADPGLFQSSPAPQKRSQQRRRGGGGPAPTWDRAAVAAAALSGGMPKPGTICYECGSKQTPQWREGPAGPRTLCNACGMRYQRSQGKCITRPKPYADSGPSSSRGGGSDYYGGGGGSPARKRGSAGRGSRGGAAKRGRGRGGKGREPWEEDDDDDYDPSFDRSAGRYGRQYAQQQYLDEDDGGGSVMGGALFDPAAAATYYSAAVPLLAPGLPVPLPHTSGLPELGGPSEALRAGGAMAVPVTIAAPAAAVTPADLRAVVTRAAAVAPDIATLSAALEGLPDDALAALPPDQVALVAALKSGVEAGLSEVKAADAAVAAVSQVLAQKRAAAERAHEGARAAAAQFRDALAAIVGPKQEEGVAAAAGAADAAGNGPAEAQQSAQQQQADAAMPEANGPSAAEPAAAVAAPVAAEAPVTV